MRIASESLSHYDQASDTYHVSYGPPVPAVTVHDPERGVLVRVEPRTQQVVGFSIPEFKAWHAEPRRGRRRPSRSICPPPGRSAATPASRPRPRACAPVVGRRVIRYTGRNAYSQSGQGATDGG